ncbi:hypothetical protein Q1695_004475 [Nippostrongylus brasiliensis]|nr:hypothetical protein Q1695_004475 [Nippostrongylus brasiliensis]
MSKFLGFRNDSDQSSPCGTVAAGGHRVPVMLMIYLYMSQRGFAPRPLARRISASTISIGAFDSPSVGCFFVGDHLREDFIGFQPTSRLVHSNPTEALRGEVGGFRTHHGGSVAAIHRRCGFCFYLLVLHVKHCCIDHDQTRPSPDIAELTPTHH